MGYFGIIVGLMGGLGLFIYGMYLLSDSLKKLSLGILRSLLEKITSNRIKSVFVGIGVTALIQSSSATSVNQDRTKRKLSGILPDIIFIRHDER